VRVMEVKRSCLKRKHGPRDKLDKARTARIHSGYASILTYYSTHCLSLLRCPTQRKSHNDDVAGMISTTTPRLAGLSLTEELAEATNDLLDLASSGSSVSDPGSMLRPLPTPSPLLLGVQVPTISTTMGVNKDAKLVLISDDDEDEREHGSNRGASKRIKKISKHGASGEVDQKDLPLESSFDVDDHLPSSRLNRLVGSVSQSTSDTALSPHLASSTDSWQHRKAKNVDHSRNVASLQSLKTNNIEAEKEHTRTGVDRTPEFFAESFPISRASDAEASTSNLEVPKATKTSLLSSTTNFGLGLPLSEPSKATLSSVEESNVTVRLHGNARLEREAQEESSLNEDQEYSPRRPTMPHSDSSQSRVQDEEDTSSLLSLPATSVTSSSQASSRARKRMVRRRSNGSASLTNEDFETQDDAPFARDVQIRGFNVVGEKSRGFVCYDVRIITIRGTTMSILRRFSSFCQLKQSLAAERPQQAKALPALPPRRAGLLHKYASHHLEKRRRALQKWLVIVMLDRRWGTTKSLREWVIGDSDDT
jgi:hypothetical protein